MNFLKNFVLPMLVSAAVLTFFAVIMTDDPIAKDLSEKSKSTAGERVIDLVTSVRGRDVTIAGVVETPEIREEIIVETDQLYGVRAVSDKLTVIPIEKPFRTMVSFDKERALQLSGFVSSRSDLNKINEKLDVVNPSAIINTTNLARGSAKELVEAFSILPELTQNLESGTLSIEDNKISIEGIAKPGGGFEALENLQAPSGFEIAIKAIERQIIEPYTFSLNAKQDKVLLAGYIPDEAARESVLMLTKQRFPGLTVEDTLEVGDGAPAGFESAFDAMTRAVGRLLSGSAEMSGTEIKISGDAYHSAAAQEISQTFPSLMPEGYSSLANLRAIPITNPIEGPACEGQIAKTLGSRKIRFATGSADIDNESAGLLDLLVYHVRSCPGANFEVAGHSDSQGKARANQRLSEARAKSVVAYLITSGLAENRFKAVGYGEQEPIADNNTQEGRARNRRIEFTFLKPSDTNSLQGTDE